MNGDSLELGEEVLLAGSALDDALAEFIAGGRTGIALRAPAKVSAAGRRGAAAGLQLAGCCVQTLRDAARRPAFENMAVLAAVQLGTGRVRAARAFADRTEGADAPQPPDPGEGYTGAVFRIDVASRLGIRLVPGPIAVWLIARDRVAGPARIAVGDPPSRGLEDPEVTKFLAAWRKRHGAKPRGAAPATVWPEQTVFGSYPTYRKSAESPAMPENGIALAARPAVAPGEDAAWALAGSFRLAVPQRHVVTEPLSGDPTTAVLPISLVITSDDVAGPIVQHLRLPSRTPVNPLDPAPVVEGYFNINLFSFPIRWRAPRRHFIYAVCGDSISPPAVTELVRKRR